MFSNRRPAKDRAAMTLGENVRVNLLTKSLQI